LFLGCFWLGVLSGRVCGGFGVCCWGFVFVGVGGVE
jgi:hypothetical protein